VLVAQRTTQKEKKQGDEKIDIVALLGYQTSKILCSEWGLLRCGAGGKGYGAKYRHKGLPAEEYVRSGEKGRKGEKHRKKASTDIAPVTERREKDNGNQRVSRKKHSGGERGLEGPPHSLRRTALTS